ncbi:MAG TPA: o-succinylbenzoate synthase [Balneolaceae bacterium]|nr:o-succinylbenzoate synthase [Balneolaceae bacterium]
MKLHFYSYKLPFTSLFRTATQTFDNREGLFLRLEKDDIMALGEAAPLPGFSDESIDDVLNQAEHYQDEIKNHFCSTFSLSGTREFLLSHPSFYPALQFSLFGLTATFLAQKKGVSLQNFLFQAPSNTVPVNAVLGAETDRKKDIKQAVKDGYHTIKLKAGYRFATLKGDVKLIRKKYPEVAIRIDANQSWTLEQATRILQELQPYDIEYCEEPLARPDTASIQKLCEISGVPIALDESIFRTFSLRQALEIAPVLIVKPMKWGFHATSIELKKIAQIRDTKLIFTTSLESGIGRLMTATLAAGLGAPDAAHGLATGSKLAEDIWQDDEMIHDGRFHLPDAASLVKLMNVHFPDSLIPKISF